MGQEFQKQNSSNLTKQTQSNLSHIPSLKRHKQTHANPHVLVSSCCYDKLLQTQWLTLTQIYYLTKLEFRGPKSVFLSYGQSVGRALFLLEALGENLSFAFRGHITITSVPGITSLNLTLLLSSFPLRPRKHPHPHLKTINLITSAMFFCHVR